MIEIKNLLFQPLTLHLAGDGRGLHLNPREIRSISDDDLSPEIEAAAKRGLVSLSGGSHRRKLSPVLRSRSMNRRNRKTAENPSPNGASGGRPWRHIFHPVFTRGKSISAFM